MTFDEMKERLAEAAARIRAAPGAQEEDEVCGRGYSVDWTPEKDQAVRDAWAAEGSIAAVGRILDVSRFTARARLKKLGLLDRPRELAARRAREQEEDEALARAYAELGTIQAAARQVGIGRDTARARLKKLGLLS